MVYSLQDLHFVIKSYQSKLRLSPFWLMRFYILRIKFGHFDRLTRIHRKSPRATARVPSDPFVVAKAYSVPTFSNFASLTDVGITIDFAPSTSFTVTSFCPSLILPRS